MQHLVMAQVVQEGNGCAVRVARHKHSRSGDAMQRGRLQVLEEEVERQITFGQARAEVPPPAMPGHHLCKNE